MNKHEIDISRMQIYVFGSSILNITFSKRRETCSFVLLQLAVISARETISAREQRAN